MSNQSSQPKRQLTRQAVTVSTRDRKNINAPVIIAPIILVAAKVIARSITAVRAVPKIPVSNTGNVLHTQPSASLLLLRADARSATPRYTTAIPSATHKNAGVTVITAVIVKNAATTPKMMLARTARAVQLLLQPQPNLFIYFHLHYILCKNKIRGEFQITIDFTAKML